LLRHSDEFTEPALTADLFDDMGQGLRLHNAITNTNGRVACKPQFCFTNIFVALICGLA
jgi:hypothetical protein